LSQLLCVTWRNKYTKTSIAPISYCLECRGEESYADNLHITFMNTQLLTEMCVVKERDMVLW
jgi:hypothetical protein